MELGLNGWLPPASTVVALCWPRMPPCSQCVCACTTAGPGTGVGQSNGPGERARRSARRRTFEGSPRLSAACTPHVASFESKSSTAAAASSHGRPNIVTSDRRALVPGVPAACSRRCCRVGCCPSISTNRTLRGGTNMAGEVPGPLRPWSRDCVIRPFHRNTPCCDGYKNHLGAYQT
jgi:hypothetical protein